MNIITMNKTYIQIFFGAKNESIVLNCKVFLFNNFLSGFSFGIFSFLIFSFISFSDLLFNFSFVFFFLFISFFKFSSFSNEIFFFSLFKQFSFWRKTDFVNIFICLKKIFGFKVFFLIYNII